MSSMNGAGSGPHEANCARELNLFEVVARLPVGHGARKELAGLLKLQLERDSTKLMALDERMRRLLFERHGIDAEPPGVGLGIVPPGTKVDVPNRVFAPGDVIGAVPDLPATGPARDAHDQHLRTFAAAQSPAKPLFRPPTAAEERLHEGGLLKGRPPGFGEDDISDAISRGMAAFTSRYSELSHRELHGLIFEEVRAVIRRA